MRPPPDLFHLKQREHLLGVVHILDLWDMFWFRVRFEPTEHFADVDPFFQKAINALDYDGPGDVDEIWEEIISHGVRLVRTDDDTVIDSFMLHIDGEHSRLRYIEPDDLEELNGRPD